MSLKIYLSYLKYLLVHKWLVFIECMKMRLYVHAFTHDLDKFLPHNFFPYARFYKESKRKGKLEKSETEELGYKYAWLRHQKRSKHHFNFWVVVNDDGVEALPIPEKYIKQIVCDWNAIGNYIGEPPKVYYDKYKDVMLIHKETRKKLIEYLGGEDG